jgi:hypothetical protein
MYQKLACGWSLEFICTSQREDTISKLTFQCVILCWIPFIELNGLLINQIKHTDCCT